MGNYGGVFKDAARGCIGSGSMHHPDHIEKLLLHARRSFERKRDRVVVSAFADEKNSRAMLAVCLERLKYSELDSAFEAFEECKFQLARLGIAMVIC